MAERKLLSMAFQLGKLDGQGTPRKHDASSKGKGGKQQKKEVKQPPPSATQKVLIIKPDHQHMVKQFGDFHSLDIQKFSARKSAGLKGTELFKGLSDEFIAARRMLRTVLSSTMAQEYSIRMRSGLSSAIATSAGGVVTNVFSVQGSSLIGIASWAVLFEEYYIRAAEFYYDNVNRTPNGATFAAIDGGYFFAAVDYTTSTTAVDSSTDILAFDTVKKIPSIFWDGKQGVRWYVDIKPLPDWDWQSTTVQSYVFASLKFYGSNANTLNGTANSTTLGYARFVADVHFRELGEE